MEEKNIINHYVRNCHRCQWFKEITLTVH